VLIKFLVGLNFDDTILLTDPFTEPAGEDARATLLPRDDKSSAKFARLIAWAKERRARRQRNPFAAHTLVHHGLELRCPAAN
jgi:hypothetical protein